MSSTQPQGGPFHGYTVSSETVQCATSSTLHGRPDSAGFPNPLQQQWMDTQVFCSRPTPLTLA